MYFFFSMVGWRESSGARHAGVIQSPLSLPPLQAEVIFLRLPSQPEICNKRAPNTQHPTKDQTMERMNLITLPLPALQKIIYSHLKRLSTSTSAAAAQKLFNTQRPGSFHLQLFKDLWSTIITSLADLAESLPAWTNWKGPGQRMSAWASVYLYLSRGRGDENETSKIIIETGNAYGNWYQVSMRPWMLWSLFSSSFERSQNVICIITWCDSGTSGECSPYLSQLA